MERLEVLLAASILWIAPVPGSASEPLYFTVNSPADVHDAVVNGICETAAGNGACTLRAALEEADGNPGYATMISFAPSVPLVQLSLGEIAVHEWVQIVGRGFRSTRVERLAGSPGARFIALDGGHLTLRDMTIASFTSDVNEPNRDGGAIRSWGDLTVEACYFEGNRAHENGGAIAHEGGTMIVRRTHFRSSHAGLGGAIYAGAGTTLIAESTFEGGWATQGGAIAIEEFAQGSIDRSSFADNSATVNGGALWIQRPALLSNSTFFANHARLHGGAIYFADGPSSPDGPLRIFNSTIAGNDSNSEQGFDGGEGGGVYSYFSSVEISNSILSGNWEWVSDGVCCFEPYFLECRGSFQSNGFNIVQALDGNCIVAGAESNADPLLQAPAFHGGPTPTMAIAPGSPAIDAGHPSGCVDALGAPISLDQRGAERPSGSVCDLGAFEYGPLIFDDDFELWEWKWNATVP